ncbi:alpha-amylase family protein [Planktothrix mougeotii]|uniref:Alpha-amylase n=1 Tax=Planktothrix mougeotii LEGE 06226 TaxID=1828728 RepID=A0ABR9U8Z1_9CYAN|nr:alpha-amylase family protein [Planktothrix mougeotii]MBE9142918.1 alpha-amylase family protein [Planktothrix mougeotii LEGE 06226]
MVKQNFWYKNAIFYSLDVETFKDANGDGVGDFQGLTQCLDYLSGLGITCLWLLPFYPSPNRDNGYDVMDYYNVDPRLGTLGDFVKFIHQAESQGIRVIIDLVVNHTSIEHPWFQDARTHKNSKYRNYYVWSEEQPPKNQPELIAFPTIEDNIWEYDQKAEAYYLHHFFKEQPDLNISNPEVQEEICKIMGFWLELGVSGFRIDAAPFLIQGVGINGETQEDLQHFLEEMRNFVISHRTDGVLLAEANVPPDKIPIYFGNGNRMQILFNFLVNQAMFLALVRQEASTLWQGLKALPDIPDTGEWLNFVRHHDELTLDALSPSELQEVFEAFAPEKNMQIFGRGIRRRLAPMMKGNRQKIELIYSLMLSLPGIPLLRYGEEIGMGDDLSLQGRTSVRTPMQWSNQPNGGFSNAPAENLTQPVISEGEYSYQLVNVCEQQRDPNSLINWTERLIRIRKQCPQFGQGKWHLLETDHPAVFAHCCQGKDESILALHNLGDQGCNITLKSSENYQYLMDVFGDQYYDPLDQSLTFIPLSAYGYRWLRVNQKN